MAVVSQQKETVEDNIHKDYGPKATLAQVSRKYIFIVLHIKLVVCK